MDAPACGTDNFPMRLPPLFLALACALPAVRAQQAPSFATPARDSAAAYIAQGDFIVTRLATECLAVVGRAESPQAFVGNWKKRNQRYVNASAKYIELRLQEAASRGPGEREALMKQVRAAVQDNGEAAVRGLLQGRKEEGCMYGVTLVDTGTLDIKPGTSQFEQLEALAKWAEE